MPADRVSVSADRVAVLVEAVIAGADRLDVSSVSGLAPCDLDDAVALYRTAGLAALESSQERLWFQARVEPTEWARAETTFAMQVAPRLHLLDDGQHGWWFLRKHPCWRLRVRTTDHEAASGLLDRLAFAGVIAGWTPGVYEPEVAAFGGSVATTIVHDLFCADSRGVLAYSQMADEPVGRRELSLLLIRTLQQRAGLDWFESADVFDRVAELRPVPDADPARVERLATPMRPLLALRETGIERLFSSGEGLADAAVWRLAFAEAGTRLGTAASNGQLGRGLRAIIAHIVIFHWNRLGLGGQTQGVLARAATAAMFPQET